LGNEKAGQEKKKGTYAFAHTAAGLSAGYVGLTNIAGTMQSANRNIYATPESNQTLALWNRLTAWFVRGLFERVGKIPCSPLQQGRSIS